MLRTRSVRLSRIGPCALRLRASAQPQGAGANPAQPDGARTQHPRLRDGPGHPAHGQTLGLLSWAIMAIAFQPVLRFYRLSPLWGPFLPAIALAYMAFTLDSAYQYVRKRGGLWKGRIQANVNGVR